METAKNRVDSKFKEGGFVNIASKILIGGISTTAELVLPNSVDVKGIEKIVNTIIEVRSCLDLR